MAILVAVALEEFGAGLTRKQFDEVMPAIFEHIPGFETLPRRRQGLGLPQHSLLEVPPGHRDDQPSSLTPEH
jgi:hypothetical protein